MLSVGGYKHGTAAFSEMANTRRRRRTFIDDAVRYLRRNRFDGIDIDWETPGISNGKYVDEKAKFTLLCQVTNTPSRRAS